MKRLKIKILSAAAAAAVAASAVMLTPGCALGQDVRVLLNGRELDFDVAPKIVNGTTLVPMRKIFEELGMKVSWDALGQTAVAVKNGKSVVAKIGSSTLTVNGEPVEAGAAPMLENGTTLVPLRVIGDALGIDVGWDGAAGTVTLTDEDKPKDESWKENTGTIDLSAMTVDGYGLSVNGKTVEVTEGGDFTVTGTASDAMIRVNTEGRVKLRLSGVSLTNPNGPAIFFENCDKGFITVSDNTSNTLTDGADYGVDAKGTLFSNDDLEIKGGGTLTVNANYKHGIVSDDELKIEEGTIIVNAAGDGIHANDEVTVTGGIITVNAVGDGISSEDFVEIEGGTINVTTTGEVAASPANDFGFGNRGGGRGGWSRRPTDLQQPLTDGQQPPMGDPQPPTDGQQPPMGDPQPPTDGQQPPMGDPRPNMDSWQTVAPPASDENTDSSSKGIKAETNLIIGGGDITVNSTDHCVHSAGTVYIDGGSLSLTSQKKKGISAHSAVIIDGGSIDILKSTEGIESKAYFAVNGGNISVTASDDGLNAGGTDGRDAREGEGHDLNINGGSISVNADGDGIDANGTIYFGGGDVRVDGPTNSGNGALDGGAGIVVSGGTLAAVGASGMAEYPRGDSVQPSVAYTASTSLEAGSEVGLAASDGSLIISHKGAKPFQSAVFSSPALVVGETYTVLVNGEAVETFTIDSVTKTVGAFGGGFGGFGGRQRRPF